MIVLRRVYNRLAPGTVPRLAGALPSIYELKEQQPPLLVTERQTSGALLIAPGTVKIVPFPQGYNGSTRLSCMFRSNNIVRFSLLLSSGGVSNVLVKGTSTQSGRYAFVDSLQSIGVYNPTADDAQVQYTLFEVPDVSDNNNYYGFVSPYIAPTDSGGSTMAGSSATTCCSRVFAGSARLDYTITPVTTGAWTTLVGLTSLALTHISVFDSSGETMELGTGSPGSEQRVLLVPPGGIEADVALAAGARIAVRAVSATAGVGEVDLNLLS